MLLFGFAVKFAISSGVIPLAMPKIILAFTSASLVISNSIPKRHKSSKVREISVAAFFAQTINSVVRNESISDKWKSNKQ